MKTYFLNIPNEERQNILNQHKHVYDGYTTNYAKPSEQPLYIQDFANDKDGITVNNKGEVKKYTNLNINEEIDEMQLDTIGDGSMDLEAGVFDEEISEDEIKIDDQENEKPPFEIDVDFYDELDSDQDVNESVKSQVNESLSWFKRISKYN
jgi:hypothetical protein